MARTKTTVKGKRPKTRKPRRPTKKAAETAARRPERARETISRKAVKRTYLFAVGRRKTAIARVRYSQEGNGALLINGQPLDRYFPSFIMQSLVRAPLEAVGWTGRGTLHIKVAGGGTHGQAESVRHGIARVLQTADPSLRPTLKKGGFLTRDARVKERKKYGLKRARRAPQWQKR